jgi:hypothetical protein
MGSVMPLKFREKGIREFLEAVANGNVTASEIGEVKIVHRDCEKYRESLPNAKPKKKHRKVPKTDPDLERDEEEL